MIKAFTKSLVGIPRIPWVKIMCPVEEMGRNSVIPSTIAIIIASNQLMGYSYVWI
jgi:hypothetical protein